MVRRSVTIVSALLTLSACSHSDNTSGARVIRAGSPGTEARPLGPGDVRIVATDSGVDLALIGDTISSGLSANALANARKGTDTAAVQGAGFSASIEKMVKSKVQDALGTRVGFPLSEITDAKYQNGAIVFEGDSKATQLFNHSNVNHKPLLESFTPADAQRFVDAVNARKTAGGH